MAVSDELAEAVKELDVVAVAAIDHGRLLLVSKRIAPDVFYLPGGKRDPGEDDLTCLRRELAEELGVGLVEPRAWREVVGPAALEPGRTMRIGERPRGPSPAADASTRAGRPPLVALRRAARRRSRRRSSITSCQACRARGCD